ncbi:MAG: hypothetical protein Q4D96_03940 [Propionibacteriaceae bacterium]|nr:hypothetical protein [Propionibacteriaceae bacterium]
MRIGELSFVVLTALLLVTVVWWPVRPGLRLRGTQALIAVTAVVLVLHVTLEFPRFLLLPTGLVFAVLVAVTWLRVTRLGAERDGGRRWASVLRRSAASLVGGHLGGGQRSGGMGVACLRVAPPRPVRTP